MARGRPKTFDTQACLEQALHYFWENGLDKASVNELARLTGTSKPSWYAEFGDKNGILRSAMELYKERYLTSVIAELEETEDAFEALQQLVLRRVRQEKSSCFFVQLSQSCLPQGLESHLEQIGGEFRNYLMKRIKQGQQDGQITDTLSSEQVSFHVHCLLAGLSVVGNGDTTTEALEFEAKLSLSTLKPNRG